ncbi:MULTISPECIES: anti-sigma factor [unclassified Nocardioides]|jgi:serine/threonine-protein kinase RsbW|uniref:anti-sigma factor n=1 Tax=unclassified Nocardioides TaxID=2615069 RepID=UPI001151F35E|nr:MULTISPECIES: anti-sigma factor [unclassified Nocardioides]TQK70462.1 serine/threonine-protein kinase RsbW [Nocardioides sp. SLBN-35]WGY00146.1 anti-sigma factor [Nocardioides sp. QY071]
MSETSSPAVGGTTAAGRPDEVELRLPADGAYASVLRTLTAGLAARLDFTMDDIEDLRIAVSEAAAMVLDEADADAVLDCRFQLGTSELALTIAAAAQTPTAPDYESFGWQVLATLADEAAIDAVAGRYSVRLLVRSSLAS